MSERAQVLVDLDAIRHNVALLAERAAGAEVLTVVKADGYGHGAEPVARAALDAGASRIGVASLDEAVALRDKGITAPLLCWLDVPGTDFTQAAERGIEVSVASAEQLAALPAGLPVHLKIDTGLNRNGCPPADWPELTRAAAKSGHPVVAMWSHLACADEPGHASIAAQAKRFDEAYAIARDAGLDPLRHLANSAATLTLPELHYDIVRPGIATYGLNPCPQPEDLIPAMTFRSSVVLVKRAPEGESVSYGHTWTADRDTTLGLIPVGYADGVPRSLSGRFSVWCNGKRRPVRGRVCMDQIVADFGDDEVAPGDEVILFGTGADGGPTATEWADTIGTIDYEIVTGMYRTRVRRGYRGTGA
ncbi:alanine racemase [Sciscionella sediminilitoris]|uniref:alanine racemase n=1 Tax=Sciscionella sediminilitoris TaxID=1445613 RepID=UPI0004DF39FC|nr:alanine racemase [Sciscionella sp. SE31]